MEDDFMASENGLHHGLTDSQKYALLALGGLTVVAVLLGVLAGRRRQPGDSGTAWITDTDPFVGTDMERSLKHLARATDARFMGFDQRLQALEQHEAPAETGGPVVTETIPNIIPAEGVNPNGMSPVATPMVGADINDTPPGPAATSMP
jgi:hypothetical protein